MTASKTQCKHGAAIYIGLGLAGVLVGPPALADDDLTSVTLTTSWYAQAEHGGYYAAKAMGIYEEHGLDVTIEMGGPDVNHQQLLAAGRTDFISDEAFTSFTAARQGVPIVTVAAYFQKDPQGLVVHEGQGYDTLADLQGVPIRVASGGRQQYWPWLRAEFGFDDSQLRPYDYNYGPFIQDKETAQQGYITNDGYHLQQEDVDVEATSLLFADYGWDNYASTLDTTREMISEDPEVVQAMVAATSEGWAAYFENPEPANELIMEDNPEMAPDLIAYSIDKMQEHEILLSGDAAGGEYGNMSRERWESFFEDMVEAGVLDEDLDWQAAFDLQFVQALYE